ncbi:MAG: flavin reductase family protein [Tepidanaerobacter acetatoxydans]|uniref:flavin reductase family protein n=1 Tax=Tepidanaerobacter acetatoxydans TaxID=499229 RepID=UPI0026ED11B7|nr:flavin reductase family protein [Tepidanaerobacter acetatoxydans]NLU11174.1 flavin reductase family protein [Tepidanaerobacter acetatoxydans]
MKELHISQVSEKIINELPDGALLTVESNGKLNTMAIGWATLGRVWNKPILTVMVRFSRFTHDVIKNADSFTVSFSTEGKLKEIIAKCGSKSGRDIDKFKEYNLTPEYVEGIESPYIAEGDLHLVCKMVYKNTMEPELLSDEIKDRWYKDNDYHTIYYGEVVKVLKNE